MSDRKLGAGGERKGNSGERQDMIGGQMGTAGSGIKGNSESIWWTGNYNEQVWRRG